jgi:hypothetical protein
VVPGGELGFESFRKFGGVNVRLNFRAVCSRAVTKWGVCFQFALNIPVGRRVVRNVLMSDGFLMPVFCTQFIIASATKVQGGRRGERSR